MKKLFILIALMALMTTFAFAQIEPTAINVSYVNTGNFDFVGSVDATMCVGISDSEMWCYGNNVEYVWIFNKDTLEVTNPYNLTEDGNTGLLGRFCEVYNNELYCFTTATDNFKIDISTGVKTALASRTFYDSTSAFNECRLRPNTDDIYCIGERTGSYNYIRVYDIGTDSWSYPINIASYNGVFPAFDMACDFVTDDLFVCYGGADVGYNTIDTLMEYDVVANTTNFISTGQDFYAGSCHALDGILYCTYGVDDNLGEPLDEIFYYDYTTDTFGTLTTTLPVEFGLYGRAGLIGTTMYNLGGYATINYDNSNDIIEVFFDVPTPVVEETITTTSSGDNTAGNAAYIQNIQKAKAAQSKQTQYNPLEQFILNLRAAILRLFGHEVN